MAQYSKGKPKIVLPVRLFRTTPGYRYRCDCKAGYIKALNGLTCEDMNECALNTDDCDQTCTNIAGTFVCSCEDGFTLNADGKDLPNNCQLGDHT